MPKHCLKVIPALLLWLLVTPAGHAVQSPAGFVLLSPTYGPVTREKSWQLASLTELTRLLRQNQQQLAQARQALETEISDYRSRLRPIRALRAELNRLELLCRTTRAITPRLCAQQTRKLLNKHLKYLQLSRNRLLAAQKRYHSLRERHVEMYRTWLNRIITSTPPILKEIKLFYGDSYYPFYHVQWIDLAAKQGKAKQRRTARRKKLTLALNRLKQAEWRVQGILRRMRESRAPYVRQLAAVQKVLDKATADYRYNIQMTVIGPTLVDIGATIVTFGREGVPTVLEAATTSLTNIAMAQLGDKPVPFYKKLDAYLKKTRQTRATGIGPALQSFSGSMTSDVKAFSLNLSLNYGIAELARKYPRLKGLLIPASGKALFTLDVIPKPASIRFAVGVSAIKGIISAYYDHKTRKAESTFFKAYAEHQLLMGVIHQSIEAERPYHNMLMEIRRAIADTQAALKTYQPVWKRKVVVNRPLSDEEFGKPVRIKLTFSSHLSAPPIVRVGEGVTTKLMDKGSDYFEYLAKYKRPTRDGLYTKRISVRLSPEERDFRQLDSDPTRTPEWDPASQRWKNTGNGIDDSHAFSFITMKNHIDELQKYQREISVYIKNMNMTLYYSNVHGYVKRTLARAGVTEALIYTDKWGNAIAYKWHLNHDSFRNFITKHTDNLSRNIDFLRTTKTSFPVSEANEIRQGMKYLRTYMQQVKNTFEKCWMPHLIHEARLLDKHFEYSKKYFAIPIGSKNYEQRQKTINAIAQRYYRQSKIEMKKRYACTASLEKRAARPPFFRSLPERIKLLNNAKTRTILRIEDAAVSASGKD